MIDTISKDAAVWKACTQYKNLRVSYSESYATWRLSKLDGILEQLTGSGKKSVYAKFSDVESEAPICEGELKSCVPIVKEFFNQLKEDGHVPKCYAIELSSCPQEGEFDPWFMLHTKIGDFEFTCL